MAMPSPPLKTQSLMVMSVLLVVVAIVHGPVQWEREISEERMVLRAVCAVLAVSRAPVELTASRRELFRAWRVMDGMGPRWNQSLPLYVVAAQDAGGGCVVDWSSYTLTLGPSSKGPAIR